MFARGAMKRVAYTREEVERDGERRYRPGLESPRSAARALTNDAAVEQLLVNLHAWLNRACPCQL
jgi:hypothetical protein